MGANGGNEVDLTPSLGAFRFASDPNWSPDGTKLAFSEFLPITNDDIFVMNADGSGQTDLTNDITTDNVQPSWAPDGTKIAWDKLGNTDQIYAMNANGTSPTNVTNDPAVDDTQPAWQPIPIPIPALIIAPRFTG